MKNVILTLGLSLFTFPLLAQSNDGLDFMRSTGKIYCVVAVILILFLGIVFYLFRLDKKITKLENQIKNE